MLKKAIPVLLSSCCLLSSLTCLASDKDAAHESVGLRKTAVYEVSLSWARLGTSVYGRAWWNKISNFELYLGAIPLANNGHLELIRELGVDRVLSMVEAFEMKPGLFNTPVTEADWEAREVGFKHIPVADFNPPNQDQLKEASAYLHEQLSDGHRVYVHCKGGKGRSVTVILAYLMEHQGMSFKEAYAHIKRDRPQVRLVKSQRLALYDFMRSLPGKPQEPIQDYL